MNYNRIILCFETAPVLSSKELLTSFVYRLQQFLQESDLNSTPLLHLLYREDIDMKDTVDLCTEMLQSIAPVSLAKYNGPVAKAVAGCFGEEEDVAVLIPGILPFLDVEECKKMMERHLKYATHYSYSDVAVSGFLFDIVSSELFDESKTGSIVSQVLEQPTIESLRSFCFRNVQDIDLDLHYVEPDLRPFRLKFDTSDSRSSDRAVRMIAKYPNLNHADLSELVANEADVCGRQPSYVEIELTTKQSGRPTVYPTRPDEKSLTEDDVSAILTSLREFPLSDDVTVCLGGRGDPFQFENLDRLIADLSRIDSVKAVYIETPATSLSRGRIESAVKAWSRPANLITLIVRLPSLKLSRYKEWMGQDRLDDVLSFLDAAAVSPLAVNLCAEMIRLPENEDELDNFMKRFESSAVTPLIGKYSRFGEQLPDLKVIDLSPLQRDYCRHLAYDMFINADGCVPVCRQQLQGGIAVGSQSLLSIFESRRNLHSLWMKGKYDQVLPICASCDDWHFYNA